MFKFKFRFGVVFFTIIAILYIGMGFLTVTKYSTNIYETGFFDNVETETSDTAFGGIFSSLQVDNSIPYFEYKKIEDSFLVAKRKRDEENRGIHYAGVSIGFMGVQQHMKQGGGRWKKNAHDSMFRYFFSLKGYKLIPHTEFFVQNNTYHLAYAKWDKIDTTNGDRIRYGHYERKSIPYRYAAEEENLLIPLSITQYKWLKVVGVVLLLSMALLFLVCFGRFPIQILVNISKGRPFDRSNIFYFKTMAIVLLVLLIIKTTVPYIIHLFLRNRIPPEFSRVAFWPELVRSLPWFLVAAALFIIGKAFESGYKLQQEQDLTI